MTDIPTIFQWISLVANVTIALAAVFGAGIAGWGLSTWRKQIKGATAHDCALRIIRAAAAYNKASQAFRHPQFGKILYASAKALAKKTQEDTGELEKEFLERHKPLCEAIISLDDEVELVVAIWGDEAVKKLEAVIILHNQLDEELKTWLFYARDNFECEEDLSVLIKPLVLRDAETDDYGEQLAKALKEVQASFAQKL